MGGTANVHQGSPHCDPLQKTKGKKAHHSFVKLKVMPSCKTKERGQILTPKKLELDDDDDNRVFIPFYLQ